MKQSIEKDLLPERILLILSIEGIYKKSKNWQRNSLPKKFLGIDSEWFPLFRVRNGSFQGIPRFMKESIPKLGTERNYMKNISFTKNLLQQTEITETFFPPRHASEGNFENMLLFLLLGTEFRVGFSSAEWFGREFLSVFFYFCSTERNSELFSPLRDGSDWNSDSFLFRETAGIPRIIFCQKLPFLIESLGIPTFTVFLF